MSFRTHDRRRPLWTCGSGARIKLKTHALVVLAHQGPHATVRRITAAGESLTDTGAAKRRILHRSDNPVGRLIDGGVGKLRL